MEYSYPQYHTETSPYPIKKAAKHNVNYGNIISMKPANKSSNNVDPKPLSYSSWTPPKKISTTDLNTTSSSDGDSPHKSASPPPSINHQKYPSAAT